MSLDPKNSTYDSRPRINPKVGRHVVRNFAIIDIGTQMESFEGKPPVPTAKVILMFEFPKSLHVFDEKKGPEPLEIFEEYTNKASDRAKICKVLKAWGRLAQSPKQLNLKPYLGKYCEMDIEHNPSKKDPSVVYGRIGDKGRNIFPVTESIDDPQDPNKKIQLIDPTTRIPYGCKAHNANIWFDMDLFNWNEFKALPKFIQDKIRKAQEWPSVIQRLGQEPMAQPAATNSQPNAQAYAQPVAVAQPAAAPITTGDGIPEF